MWLASGDSTNYSRKLPKTATANRILGCRAVGPPIQSNQYKNHATLYPGTLNTLHRLEQHTHLILRQPTPLAEVWVLA